MMQIADAAVAEHFVAGSPIPSRVFERAIRNVIDIIEGNLALARRGASAETAGGADPGERGDYLYSTAFWPGLLWLAYEATDDPKYAAAAAELLERSRKSLAEKDPASEFGVFHTLACVAAYRISGDANARQMGLAAADYLSACYQTKAGFIQIKDPAENAAQTSGVPIHSLLNLPLLYWASKVSGERGYHLIAYRHARQAALYMVRDDFSTNHTVYLDEQSGVPLWDKLQVGPGADSCLARSQAWGIYGFALSYIYTRDWHFLVLAKRLADYFLARLPKDGICQVDLACRGENQPKDSSAAALAVCGLLELSKHLPMVDDDKRSYENAALTILSALVARYAATSATNSGRLLKNAAPDGDGERDYPENAGYGDYYFLEALLRVTRDWEIYW